MKKVLFLISLVLLVPLPAFSEETPPPKPAASLIEEGDRYYAERAEGAIGHRASAEKIDAAIAAYRKALELDPESIAARARMLRAIYFKGEYTTEDREEKKKIFSDGKPIAEEALEWLRTEASHRTGKPMAKASPVDLSPILKDSPDAIECFIWSAADWGGWALAYGKLAAAREGVAGKIRAYATAVTIMSPNYGDGAGYRILGRLHHQTPRIPFITGWVSSEEAIRLLRLANEAGPRHFLNRLYLAEALLDEREPVTRAEALKILESMINDTPRPEHLIEERAAQAKAAELWELWRKI
jgi:tetratricopeptide (TPR) repeat protein